MKTSVITSTVTRKTCMLRLFENLATQTVLPDEIILIEAGEALWNKEELPALLQDRFTVFYAPKESLAASRDRGRKAAKGEYLIFIDDDIIMPPNYIETAINYLDANTATMGVGGIYTDPIIQGRSNTSARIGKLFGIYADGSSNRILPSGWADYVRGSYAQNSTPAEWLFGCNAVLRAIAFSLPGVGFETQMAAWSFAEDVIFGARLTRAKGVCMRVLPELKVIHAPTTSSGQISRLTLRMRILYRYIFWRELVATGTLYNRGQFCLGMLANLLLMLKQERKFWVISECLKTHIFTLRHRSMNWETANEFIFSRN